MSDSLLAGQLSGPDLADLKCWISAQMTEKAFQAIVIKAAKLFHWLCYHTHDSRRSPEGFPDLVMVRRNRLIFAELKTEKGRVKLSQKEWLDALREAGEETYVWRPSAWQDITRILTEE